MKMCVVIVTGIPGVGSSTVIKEAFKRKKELNDAFVYVNYGDVMFEVARSEGLVKNRDEIRKLPGEKQREIQKLACKKILELGRNVIIDTHCTVKTPLGYLPGLPEHILTELKPKELVLIEASPEEVLSRRDKDKTRDRDVEERKDVEEHQMMNRAMAMAYACLTGAAVKIIENHDGAVDKAAEEFINILNLLSQ
ncbi:MAG: adenylate kinase [Candidatus Methanospirareceae archaeon]